MDWMTFTKEEVDNDALPDVCMECGAPATCRVNETFSYTPDWVGWLYLAGVVPGIVASELLEREMRVSCPFCAQHGELPFQSVEVCRITRDEIHFQGLADAFVKAARKQRNGDAPGAERQALRGCS